LGFFALVVLILYLIILAKAQIGLLLRKLSPGAGFFDSDFRQVTRDCFQPLHESDHLSVS
jgi:hypothetical protein